MKGVVGGGGIFYENGLQIQGNYVTARILEISRPLIFSSTLFFTEELIAKIS